MSILERTTVDYALAVLDSSYSDIWSTKVGPQRESQFAYYNGQKRMLEMLITDIFKKATTIDVSYEGRHFIKEGVEEALPVAN